MLAQRQRGRGDRPHTNEEALLVLEGLRNFVGGWTAKILLVLLVGSFALWGIDQGLFGGADANTVANVGETRVTTGEFLSTYNRNINQLQQRAGRRLTREQARVFGVEQRSLGTVIAYATLDEYAREQGLALSDQRLAQMIAQNPAFHDSTGKFDRSRFQQAIYGAQLRESDFIALENKSAIRNQVLRSFATDEMLPDIFENAMAEFADEERRFKYITITPEMAGALPAPTDEQLQSYFDENKSTYRAPEYRKLDILALTPDRLADEAAVTSEEIAADYESRKNSYGQPEKRRIQQIVFKSAEKAQEAKQTLAEGGFFETVLSDNDVTVTDADLGLVAKTDLPSQLQEVAFSLESGTPSDVIDGPFGPTMLRVTEIAEASITPLEEVEADIRKELALRRAADRIDRLREEVEDARAGGTSLKEIAEQQQLKLRTIDAIDRTARTDDGTIITDIPNSRDLLDQAFQTEVGAQASSLDIGSAGTVWYDVLEISEARDRTFDEVKERVQADWTAAEQNKRVEELAQTLKKRLEGGADFDAIAAEYNVLAEETAFLKRRGNGNAFPATAIAAGFAGNKDLVAISPVAVGEGKADNRILLTVDAVKKPEAEKSAINEQTLELANQGAADDMLSQMIASLQSRYEVTQNPRVIDLAITQRR
ncbi:MAG: SurA N-terminal domain-containing protein [Pseudomonadota bacterium]